MGGWAGGAGEGHVAGAAWSTLVLPPLELGSDINTTVTMTWWWSPSERALN